MSATALFSNSGYPVLCAVILWIAFGDNVVGRVSPLNYFQRHLLPMNLFLIAFMFDKRQSKKGFLKKMGCEFQKLRKT